MQVDRIPEPATRRRVDAGELIGSREPGGTHGWRGIPYAQPPVGALRWRAPRPVLPWRGVREGLSHGPIAPQYGELLAPVPQNLWGQVVGEEDCLSLNVFAPEAAYTAAKGGLVALTIQLAREFASSGVRAMTIAPGIFKTALFDSATPQVQQALSATVPFPPRPGQVEEFAELALHIVHNRYLNGEVIRLDGAARMAAR